MLTLNVVSQTATKITFGWTPVPGAAGYAFYADGVRKANSWDPTRSQVSFAKGSRVYRVDALGVTASGSYPAAVAPPPPPIPPPSGRPASFFTGPLGNSNIVPRQQGAFLIGYPGIVGGTWAQVQAMIGSREQAMGRKYDGLHTQYWWGRGTVPAEASEQRLQWIHGRNQIPCVSHYGNFSIGEVNQGLADAHYTAAADYYKALGFPVMLRLFWEFNNPAGFPWCVGYTGSVGAPFVAAWQRVVNIFKARGASNVGFWWCPMEGSDRAATTASYPGDTFVDWAGSDGYNGCMVGQQGCYSGYALEGWASFEQVCLYTGKPDKSAFDMYGARKPFVYGEVGTKLDPAFPSYKATWFKDIPAALKLVAPGACGISFFDQDVSKAAGEDPSNNWLVDYGTGAMGGFSAMAQDPWLNTGSV